MARQPFLKHLNERAVLDTIRAGAPISRAQISRSAGISKPTASAALTSLLDAGLVRETDAAGDGPTYGAVFFEPVPEAALVLGLDLGTRFLRGAICDLAGSVRARQDVELPRAEAGEVLDRMADLTAALVEATGLPRERVDSAVVGVPGAVAPDGRVLLAENIHGLEDLDVAAEAERVLGMPVTVENDVNLAALGERWRGVGRGVDDFVFVSVGTGLGAGLVLGGELHRGRNGLAGEVDLARLEPALDPSAPALSRLAAERAAGAGTALAPPFDPRDVFAAARRGDAVAREVVAEEARRIALHVVPIAAVVDVGLVVLGGGVGSNGDLLVDPICTELAQRLPAPPRVEVSALGESAVLDGALAIGRDDALDRVFEQRPIAL
ncbi:MAG: ROK family transcriptional regulator [Actinobacteria bacterium]|nr:MAG: ROK family transcriptional regulator [Actinomycetota bacterium]